MPANRSVVEKIIERFMNVKINEEVIYDFVKDLIENVDMAFDPDVDFDEYTDEDGQPTFDEVDAQYLNEIFDNMYHYCHNNGIDLYELITPIQHQAYKKKNSNDDFIEEDMNIGLDGEIHTDDYESAYEEDNEDTAYDKGREACFKGAVRESNPYSDSDEQVQMQIAWNTGYDEMTKENQQTENKYFAEGVKYYNTDTHTVFIIKENKDNWVSLINANSNKETTEDVRSFKKLVESGIYHKIDL